MNGPTTSAAGDEDGRCRGAIPGRAVELPLPSPGGQVSGMASLRRSAALSRVSRGCGVPSPSLKGYHTPARGQSEMAHTPVPSRAAPGLACGRAMPGRGDATQPPARKIVVGGRVELVIVWILCGHKTHPANRK